MATGDDDQLGELKAQLDEQNERWRRALSILALLGDVRVSVRREFFERLDALAPKSSPAPRGLRG
jgi:hypothetical protein